MTGSEYKIMSWFSKRTGRSFANIACSTNTQIWSNWNRNQTLLHDLPSSSDVLVCSEVPLSLNFSLCLSSSPVFELVIIFNVEHYFDHWSCREHHSPWSSHSPAASSSKRQFNSTIFQEPALSSYQVHRHRFEFRMSLSALLILMIWKVMFWTPVLVPKNYRKVHLKGVVKCQISTI